MRGRLGPGDPGHRHGQSHGHGQSQSQDHDRSHARGRARVRARIAVCAAAVAFAAAAGRFAPLSAPAEFAVLGAGVPVFAWAVRTPADQRRPAPEHVDGRGSLVWLGLLLAFLAWELYALARGSTPAHPTLSILLGPLLAEPVVRSVGYLLWLAAGVWLVKR